MAARRITSTETTAPTSLPRRGQGRPGMLIILGLLILGFAGLVITLQTQTNEAYINGTQHVDNVIQAQWTIWLQIPKLMFGSNVPGPDVTSSELSGVLLGQGIEIVYLALIAGLQITLHTSSKLGKLFGTLVTILLFVIAVFNFYTDLV